MAVRILAGRAGSPRTRVWGSGQAVAPGFWLRRFLLLCACGVLWGCAGAQLSDGRLFDADASRAESVSRREEVDAIPASDIPAALRSQAAPKTVEKTGERLEYAVDISAPEADLKKSLQAVSILIRLQDDPPTDKLGLDRRILYDLDEARRILQSDGYYAGSVVSEVDDRTRPVTVRIRFDPGPVYHVAAMKIQYSPPPSEWPEAPASLADVGLKPGQQARAADILDAVDKVSDSLKDNGYPFAVLEKERYVVDHATRTLDADIVFNPGAFATMGKVQPHGSETVDDDYFARMRNWTIGAPWNESVLAAYQEQLAGQGLFRSVVITPSETSEGSRRDVVVQAADAPQRTVSGGIRFDTDRGPGAQTAWENRNIFGSGERFRVEGEWWKDMQVARATFRRPGFLRRDTDLVAESWVRNESTDAFDQTAAWAGAGLDRRFWKIWVGSLRGTVEGGTLSTRRAARSEYFMLGLPVSVRRDSTDNLLNPSRGSRLGLSFAPYSGTFHGDFTATVTRADGSAYYDLSDDGRFILAGRLAAGTVSKDGRAIPSSLLFYSGGGGSVRGYAYQSLGPQDRDDDPLGGMSMLETSLEMRLRLTETIGIVPFLDGGNVYNGSWPELDMRWGAGLGLRYYTSIGPIRFDVAAPLNKRSQDAPWQVYISIGQSF